ncbi:hypothetical protein [Acinetobacter sp.]|uniref:hypothetical protein n=1 Tax=Acinetobacter sp. TaxID=472 RepID=UPI00388E4B6C
MKNSLICRQFLNIILKVLTIFLFVVFYLPSSYSQGKPTEKETLEFINTIINKVNVEASTSRIKGVQTFNIDLEQKSWVSTFKFSDGSVSRRTISLSTMNGRETLSELKSPTCIIMANEFQIYSMEMMAYKEKVRANIDKIAFYYDATIPGERERLINALEYLIELKNTGVNSFFEPKS